MTVNEETGETEYDFTSTGIRPTAGPEDFGDQPGADQVITVASANDNVVPVQDITSSQTTNVLKNATELSDDMGPSIDYNVNKNKVINDVIGSPDTIGDSFNNALEYANDKTYQSLFSDDDWGMKAGDSSQKMDNKAQHLAKLAYDIERNPEIDQNEKQTMINTLLDILPTNVEYKNTGYFRGFKDMVSSHYNQLLEPNERYTGRNNANIPTPIVTGLDWFKDLNIEE